MNPNSRLVTTEGAPIDDAFVIAAFEDASRTLAALPAAGYGTGIKTSRLMVLDEDPQIFAHNDRGNRPARPAASAVDAMDVIFSWLAFIPEHRRVLRKIVAARSVTREHIGEPASWRSIGNKLGIDYRSARAWHAQGIGLIVARLRENADL